MPFHLSNVVWPNSDQVTIHIPENGLKPNPRPHLGNESVMVGLVAKSDKTVWQFGLKVRHSSIVGIIQS